MESYLQQTSNYSLHSYPDFHFHLHTSYFNNNNQLIMLSYRQDRNQDQDILIIRQKLQLIIQTLLYQKRIFQTKYNNKIQQYQTQLIYKNAIIEQLNHQLSNHQQQLIHLKNKEQSYRNVINDLQAQLSKIVTVVHDINIPVIGVNRGQVDDPFIKIEVKKINRIKSTERFDINQYFQQIKQISHSPSLSLKPFSQSSTSYKGIQAKCLQDLTNTNIKQNDFKGIKKDVTFRFDSLPTHRLMKDIKCIPRNKENLWKEYK